ncbi:Na+/H+ antiporter subunit E [Solwaraspora sp. WMMD1047]|uniref:Na+/H+ antiporter subunit E n=1 Tax=Solwaraspora sp. WMMD1047 TaxID=3016102 RepID=UPI002416B3AD|nr:Na+/H+ antiporter subunit E [Solwaraspora sp. WMMD1047]MDG4832159.1 Na+/H+ antiporter subunit E [Solwaraspora sp. WMMD1047]
MNSGRSGLLRRFALRTGRIVAFLGYFVGRLVAANIMVAREIVTPGTGFRPGIVDYPARPGSRSELVLLSLIIGLTPGTLTVAVSQRPRVLYVHGMRAEDLAAFRRDLAEMEWRMLLALRPVDRPPAPVRPIADGVER